MRHLELCEKLAVQKSFELFRGELMLTKNKRLAATTAVVLALAVAVPVQGTIAAPPTTTSASSSIPPGQTEESVKIRIPKSGQSLNDALSSLPQARNSETNLQPMTVKLLRLIETIYPYYGQDGVIGGYREDALMDHPSGQALDIMMRGGAHAEQDVIDGHQIAAFLMINARELGVKYMVWRQQIWYPGREWRLMNDRGDWTQNHKDHIHVLVDGQHTPEGLLVMPVQIQGIKSQPTLDALEQARQGRIKQVQKELKLAKKNEKVSLAQLKTVETRYGTQSAFVRSSNRKVSSLAREAYMFGGDMELVTNAVGWMAEPHVVELGQKVTERERKNRSQVLDEAKIGLRKAKALVEKATKTHADAKNEREALEEQLVAAKRPWLTSV